jgi:metal-responsive CopG/Arc/MetJ family transcriptional regulator
MTNLIVGTGTRRKNVRKRKVFSVAIGEDTIDEFRQACKRYGYNQSLIVARALRLAVQQMKEANNDNKA